jgi:hypothetical protein
VSHNKFTEACKPLDTRTLRRWQTVDSRTRVFDVRKPGGGGGMGSIGLCTRLLDEGTKLLDEYEYDF